jgi:integrase
MRPRVFKQKGSRVYRGRYRIGDDLRIHDVPLHTEYRHVAEAKLRQLVRQKEEELAGIAAPKTLLDAAKCPVTDHLTEYVADVRARSRSKKHVSLVGNRIARLAAQCGWKRICDITADSFVRWRAKQTTLGEKTLNEYLTLASAFVAWLERHGRATHNPLKAVVKSETAGRERRVRRALSQEEVDRLIAVSGRRRAAYLLALYTGLRRGELKKLSWLDVHLDAPKPYLEIRAATTKNNKRAVLPLLPVVADALRQHQAKEQRTDGKVFRIGVPTAKSLTADLITCGIKPVDSLGRIVDFHALRHTFATLLNQAGVAPRVVMELMRHSDMRLTHKTYTDATSLALFTELEKLSPGKTSLPASLNQGRNRPNSTTPVPTADKGEEAEIVAMPRELADLGKVVPDWTHGRLAERVGFEPTVPFRARLISSQVR